MFKIKQNNNRIFYRTALGFFAFLFLFSTLYFNIQIAQATPGMLPFGGPILMQIPAPIPNPLAGFAPCPAHLVILDYSLVVPKPVGIVTMGASNATPGFLFMFGFLYIPGIQTLGEYVPVPIVTCAGLPYPVFQAFFNPEMAKFQIGTGAIPGF